MKISSSLFIVLALAGVAMQRASASDFNPQPDPPRQSSKISKTAGHVNAGDTVGFNPQPDPPVTSTMQANEAKPGVSNPSKGVQSVNK